MVDQCIHIRQNTIISKTISHVHVLLESKIQLQKAKFYIIIYIKQIYLFEFVLIINIQQS